MNSGESGTFAQVVLCQWTVGVRICNYPCSRVRYSPLLKSMRERWRTVHDQKVKDNCHPNVDINPGSSNVLVKVYINKGPCEWLLRLSHSKVVPFVFGKFYKVLLQIVFLDMYSLTSSLSLFFSPTSLFPCLTIMYFKFLDGVLTDLGSSDDDCTTSSTTISIWKRRFPRTWGTATTWTVDTTTDTSVRRRKTRTTTKVSMILFFIFPERKRNQKIRGSLWRVTVWDCPLVIHPSTFSQKSEDRGFYFSYDGFPSTLRFSSVIDPNFHQKSSTYLISVDGFYDVVGHDKIYLLITT